MLISEFKEMLDGFIDEDVEFLIVGGHCVSIHGHVRATGDIDFWIRQTRENVQRAHRALVKFGASMAELSVDDLLEPGTGFMMGVPPNRIDILTSIEGVEFAEAWEARIVAPIDEYEVPTMSLEHLLKNKLTSGRSKDLYDVEELRAIHDLPPIAELRKRFGASEDAEEPRNGPGKT
ncbi:hypothetical protein BH23GEM10_BH23GEM10_06090 [soil metagenome]